jgi:hypothetical protein
MVTHSAQSASAQVGVVTIEDKVVCQACGMVLGPPVTLADGNGAPVRSGPPASIVENSRGEFIAAYGRDLPGIYDSRGGFVRSIGRSGEGPGEFRSAEIILLGDADSLLIIDRGLQRLTLLSPEGRYVRSAPIPDGTYSAARTIDGKVVLMAQVPDRARFAKPFHVLDRLGNYVLSFGEGDGTAIPGQTPPLSRWVRAAARGGFWSVPVHGNYLIERWSTDGVRQGAYRRVAEWFPTSGTRRLSFSRDLPPTPQILSIAEDEGGIVWIAIRVADANWRSAVRWDSRRAGEQALRPVIEDRSKAFDVIIEAVDVANAQLVARERLDVGWASFTGDNRLMTVRDLSDGNIDVRLQKFSLRSSRDRKQ